MHIEHASQELLLFQGVTSEVEAHRRTERAYTREKLILGLGLDYQFRSFHATMMPQFWMLKRDMRPGEIFGLRWSSFRVDHFHIEGTAWRGTLRPGKTKTKGSKASVTIPDVLFPALELWRAQNAAASIDALIFPSDKGTPMRPENWLRRRIKPIATAAGICVPVNFQVLRRTFATNAQGFGNPKDVQAPLRHIDITTTFNEHTQTVPESVRKLVNAVTNDVMSSKPVQRVQ